MKNLIIILSLFISLSIFPKGKFTAQIELSPVGSFEVTSKKVKGKIQKANGVYTALNISIKVKSLKTGIDLRDAHLRKRFSSKKILIIEAKGQSGKGVALIKINGIPKKIPFKFKDLDKEVQVELQIKLSDFNFKDLSYLGVSVDDIVKISSTISIK